MTDSDGVKPSLDDARARVDRASEHINSLFREVGRITREQGAAAVLRPYSEVTPFDAPPIVSVLIGEIVYNLKAALDYLVYELAYLDTGERQSGTKFLIEDAEQGWLDHLVGRPNTKPRDLKRLWLPKLSPAHQAALKGLQPFTGVKWTLALRELTNPDKHRRLTRLVGNTAVDIFALGPKHPAMPPAFPEGMFVNFHVVADLAFENGAHVIETLQHLQEQVAGVIQAFDPDFQ